MLRQKQSELNNLEKRETAILFKAKARAKQIEMRKFKMASSDNKVITENNNTETAYKSSPVGLSMPSPLHTQSHLSPTSPLHTPLHLSLMSPLPTPSRLSPTSPSHLSPLHTSSPLNAGAQSTLHTPTRSRTVLNSSTRSTHPNGGVRSTPAKGGRRSVTPSRDVQPRLSPCMSNLTLTEGTTPYERMLLSARKADGGDNRSLSRTPQRSHLNNGTQSLRIAKDGRDRVS